MKWRKPKQPIVINTFELRVAIELAAGEAARRELCRQLKPHFPGLTVTVDTWAINLTSIEFAPLEANGHPVEFPNE